MMFSLGHRTALVTGASRGLGRAIAQALAQAGAHVIVNGRDAGRLAPVVETISESGGRAQACAFDIADAAGREAALADLAGAGQTIDILVNNVGRRHRGPVSAIDHAAFLDLLDADLAAPYALTRGARPGHDGAGHRTDHQYLFDRRPRAHAPTTPPIRLRKAGFAGADAGHGEWNSPPMACSSTASRPASSRPRPTRR